jgi:PAS domain S-box-containing protein
MIVDEARDYAILTTDPDGRVTSWSPGAAAIFGWSGEEALGRMVDFTFTPEDRAAGEPARDRALARANGVAPDVRWHLHRDGGRVFIEGTMRALRDPSEGLRGYLKVGQDVTARRATEEALRQALADVEQSVSERTAELAQALVERDLLRRELSAAEEEERRRLSRELHDQLGQHLTAFALGLADVRRLLAEGAPAEPRLAQLEELTRMMTRDARYLALELRPPELDDVGLESALQTYAAQWSARYGVEAEVAVTGGSAGCPLPGDVGTALYRIAQEALTNVARHAEARHVTVQLDVLAEEIRLIIEDDGRGFDPEAAARARRERRLGLAGMRERASLAAGSLEIESSPERGGTTVYVRVSVAGP